MDAALRAGFDQSFNGWQMLSVSFLSHRNHLLATGKETTTCFR